MDGKSPTNFTLQLQALAVVIVDLGDNIAETASFSG
jgi:hypothetical protein